MIPSRSYLKSIISRFLDLILLVISLVTGFFELIICDRILMFLFSLLKGTNKISRPVYMASWFLLGIGYPVFLVLTGEYHFERLGKPASWALFVKTFVVQAIILAIGYFI